MIRSNPTAIPLRPSDVKALQVELERRRQPQEAQETQSQRTERGAGAGEGNESVTERAPRQVMTQPPRDNRSVQERIGL